jgi:hypothetical protein
VFDCWACAASCWAIGKRGAQRRVLRSSNADGRIEQPARVRGLKPRGPRLLHQRRILAGELGDAAGDAGILRGWKLLRRLH